MQATIQFCPHKITKVRSVLFINIHIKEGHGSENKGKSLKVVRTRVKRVLIYSKIENTTLSALPWTLVANFLSKEAIFCRYLPATA